LCEASNSSLIYLDMAPGWGSDNISTTSSGQIVLKRCWPRESTISVTWFRPVRRSAARVLWHAWNPTIRTKHDECCCGSGFALQTLMRLNGMTSPHIAPSPQTPTWIWPKTSGKMDVSIPQDGNGSRTQFSGDIAYRRSKHSDLWRTGHPSTIRWSPSTIACGILASAAPDRGRSAFLGDYRCPKGQDRGATHGDCMCRHALSSSAYLLVWAEINTPKEGEGMQRTSYIQCISVSRRVQSGESCR
jgi:hypothetical protein